jgi:hypothetical protein
VNAPNPAHSLDGGIPSLLNAEHRWPAASDEHPYAAMSQCILPHQCLIALASGVLVVTLLTGCAPAESRTAGVREDADRVYRAYLEGDVNQARRNLEQMIHVFETRNAQIGRMHHAHGLYFGYARLYVLEKRVGNKESAETALIKARYWFLQSYESSEDGWKNRVSLPEILSMITPERIAKAVDEEDKTRTRGKAPGYAQ